VALVVITGGVRSGKSAAAQRLAASRAQAVESVCVATFARPSADPELAERIARHREDRDAGFAAIEAENSTEWLGRVPDDSLLLVDCIGTLLGRLMEESWPVEGGTLGDAAAEDLPSGYAERVSAAFDGIVTSICDRDADTIVVTNEVGAGVVPVWASARLFTDLIGRANRTLVSRADAAYFAVCGRLMDLTLLPTDATWPDAEKRS